MPISIFETTLGPIEVRLVGKGRPLLFIHGGHVDCRETIFQKGLDPGMFQFICPSRPGYGQTPLSRVNASSKGSAELLIALLDKLGVSQATVIGISAGGLTALELAANYPERVEQLILMSALTKNWFNKTAKVYKGGKIIFSPAMEAFTWFLYRQAFRLFENSVAKLMFRELSKFRPIEFTHDELSELKKMTMKMRSRKGFSNDLDQSVDPASLSKIECRVLVLHSEYDNSVDASHPENALQLIKSCKLVTFKNRWGHLLWLGSDYDKVLFGLNTQLLENK